jgi:hypothetical protein
MPVNFLEENQIAQLYPKTFEDFIEFYKESETDTLELEIEHLPFPFQVGWFLKYFEKNSVSINIIDISEIGLKDNLLEAFNAMEHLLSHYS